MNFDFKKMETAEQQHARALLERTLGNVLLEHLEEEERMIDVLAGVYTVRLEALWIYWTIKPWMIFSVLTALWMPWGSMVCTRPDTIGKVKKSKKIPVTVRVMERKELSFTLHQRNTETASPPRIAVSCSA